jgi:hypothetical protein
MRKLKISLLVLGCVLSSIVSFAQTSCTGPTAVYTSTVPTRTGLPDASWNGAPINAINKYVPGTGTGSQLQSDYAAQWRAMFDVNNLYVLVEVKDGALYPAPVGTGSPWMYDAVEIYTDGSNTKPGSYNSTDHQFGFTYGTSAAPTILYGSNGNSSLQYTMVPTSWPGYNLIATIPWTAIGITAPTSAGNISIGFDINIQDNDNGSTTRAATAAWNTTSSQEFNNPSLFGTATLSMCTIGTVDYVAKFNSTTTLTKSQIYDNGTFVGIGTTATSTAKLNVNGTVKATGLQLTTNPGVGKVLTSDSTGTGSWLAVDLSSGWKLAGNNNATTGNFIGTTNAQPVILKTNNVEAMRLNTDGTIGIGDSYVASGYKVAINGKLIATEIAVKLRTKWPDYVFAKEYKLMSLGEVEKYIQEHKHLPGLPAASEVEEDGMQVGEINTKLTEKVEELTLYMIEQQKLIEAQKEANEKLLQLLDAQNKRIETLEKKK